MSETRKSLVPRIGMLFRTAAVALIAGVCRWKSIREINASIASRPVAEQTAITLAVLGALFALSLVAAQFGWVGVLVFWLGIVLIVN